MESRKEFEERLLTELLDEIRPESLPNLLMYAAAYLRGEKSFTVRPVDLQRAEAIEKCQREMATRIREVRS